MICFDVLKHSHVSFTSFILIYNVCKCLGQMLQLNVKSTPQPTPQELFNQGLFFNFFFTIYINLTHLNYQAVVFK